MVVPLTIARFTVPVVLAVTCSVNTPGVISVSVPKVTPAVPRFCRSLVVKVAASMSAEKLMV